MGDPRRHLNRKQLLDRGILFVLVDLTVLNLFVEHWDRIVIDSFTISLFTAVILQVLLKATLAVEHRIAHRFEGRTGAGATVARLGLGWLVLFGSKFVILEAVDLAFGDHVDFGGVLPFVVVVATLMVAERALEMFHRALIGANR